MFGNEIWTAIGGLRTDPQGKENADTKRANSINDDLHLLKGGNDYRKNNGQSWVQGQERRQDRVTEHRGQQIEEIQPHVETRNVQRELAFAKQFHEELKKFEQQRQRDEERHRQGDALFTKRLPAAEEKSNRAKG
jgi:hypothetical protein